MNADPRRFVHRIDGKDVLRFVNDDWRAFASENEGESLQPARILGIPLYEFIAGPETRHIYRLLYSRVRDHGVEVTFPFRCDSPSIRRFMTMSMSRFREDWITFACRVDRLESRPFMALLDAARHCSDEFLKICSWCKRIDLGDDGWQEVEVAVASLGLLSAPALPQLTHGICPECDEALRDTHPRR